MILVFFKLLKSPLFSVEWMNWWGTKCSTSQDPKTLCLPSWIIFWKIVTVIHLGNFHPTCLKKHMLRGLPVFCSLIPLLRLHNVEWCFGGPRYSELRFLSPTLKIESIHLVMLLYLVENLPYHQTFDGNYWSHIFFEIFLKDIFLLFNFPKKTQKNIQKGLQERTVSETPSAIGIWVAHKPAWPEKWMTQMTGCEGFASETKHGFFFGLWLDMACEFSWSWVLHHPLLATCEQNRFNILST